MSVAAVNRFVPSQFLDGLSAEALTAVLQVAKRRQFSANSVVLHQGYPSEHLLLLTHGRARHFFITEDGQKVVMRWLVPGDITGGMALLARLSRYQVSTEAVKDSQFLIWDRITLGHLTTRYPRLLQNVLFIAEVFFDWYITAHVALSCDSARQRCASVLTNMAHALGHKVAGGIEIAVTNEELASAAAVTLFDASRFVSGWHRPSVIEKTRGKVLVRSLDLLCQEARK